MKYITIHRVPSSFVAVAFLLVMCYLDRPAATLPIDDISVQSTDDELSDLPSSSPEVVSPAVKRLDDEEEDTSANEIIEKPPTPLASDESDDVNHIPAVPYPESEDVRRPDGLQQAAAGAVGSAAAAAGESAGSGDGSARSAPKYMLDLYNKFSTDKYSHPMANIVRSFTNVNTGKLTRMKFNKQ